MKFTHLALACLGLIALTGCKPQSAEPVASVESPAVVAVAVAQVAVANAAPSDRNSTFDQRGFAGTFSRAATGTATGAETRLVLDPDGSFRLTEAQAGSVATATLDGTWTVEAEDRHIRLDPNSKAEPDRLFAITSTDRIIALASDGQPVPGGDLARQESPATR